MSLPADIKSRFPLLQREVHGSPIVYLDSAASSQKPDCVLDAMALLKDETKLKLVICGHGNYRATLEQRVQEEGIPGVIFQDTVPRERFPNLLAAADLCLVARDGRFAGHNVPYQAMEVSRLINSAAVDVDPARVEKLISLLEIDKSWNLTTVSDGQRRRVQILCKLIEPKSVLLLDEITTDLDLLARHHVPVDVDGLGDLHGVDAVREELQYRLVEAETAAAQDQLDDRQVEVRREHVLQAQRRVPAQHVELELLLGPGHLLLLLIVLHTKLQSARLREIVAAKNGLVLRKGGPSKLAPTRHAQPYAIRPASLKVPNCTRRRSFRTTHNWTG